MSQLGDTEQLLAMEEVARKQCRGQFFAFGIYIYFKYIHIAKIINYF